MSATQLQLSASRSQQAAIARPNWAAIEWSDTAGHSVRPWNMLFCSYSQAMAAGRYAASGYRTISGIASSLGMNRRCPKTPRLIHSFSGTIFRRRACCSERRATHGTSVAQNSEDLRVVPKNVPLTSPQRHNLRKYGVLFRKTCRLRHLSGTILRRAACRSQVRDGATHRPRSAAASSRRRAAKFGQSVRIAVSRRRLGTSSIGTHSISILSSSLARGSTSCPGFSKANTVV